MVYMYSVAVSLTPYLCRILLWNFFSPLQTFSVSLDAYFFHAVQQCSERTNRWMALLFSSWFGTELQKPQF